MAWLPFAFAYRRSADEELYYAIANAIRGLPYDRALLFAKRGETTSAFRRLPPSDGHWHMPYTDVPFEYPVILLPFILLPAMWAASFDAFAVILGGLMAVLMVASVAIAIDASAGAQPANRAAGWWTAAALFLAQGGLLVQRLDAVVAAFLALALWAAVRRKHVLLGLAAGLVGAAKVIPVLVLLTLIAADSESYRSTKPRIRVAAGLLLGLAIGFVPMIVFAPEGFLEFVRYHASRGLHVESTYGALMGMARTFGCAIADATLSAGSFNLSGRATSLFATASTAMVLAATLMFAAWLTRRPRAFRSMGDRPGDIALAGLGSLLILWLFGKVFSPQYLTWGIPFVVALGQALPREPGIQGSSAAQPVGLASPMAPVARRLTLLFGLALAITQLYLRGFYDQVVAMRPLGALTLAVRLVLLVTMVVIVLQTLSPRARSGTPGATA